LKVDGFLDNWSGGFGSVSSFSSVCSSSVEHSSSGSSGNSTVDVTTNISRTRDSDSILNSSRSSWGSNKLDSNLSNNGSLSSSSTISSLGDTINGSKGSCTRSSSCGSSIIDLSSKWIRMNSQLNSPSSLFSSSVGGGIEKSSLCCVSGSFSSVSSSRCSSFWNTGWEIWGWLTEESTILISNSTVWNSQSFSESTTSLKNVSIVSDITDGLTEGKSDTNSFTTVILSGHVDSLGGGKEPILNGVTVESSIVFTSRSRLESASSLGTSSSNSSVAPL